MNITELKAEAKKHGYYLVKSPSYTRMLPCTCGSKRRRCYVESSKGKVLYGFTCIKCGNEGPKRRSIDEARQAWNEMVGG